MFSVLNVTKIVIKLSLLINTLQAESLRNLNIATEVISKVLKY